jgi:hypothetical protein
MNIRSIPSVHSQIRYAWQRFMLPAYGSRDTAALLAALVVADTCLGELLLAEGHAGASFSERLWNARRSFSDYASLCAARLVRHKAVHDLTYHLHWETGAIAIASYARALWEHGVDLTGDSCLSAEPPVLRPAPLLRRCRVVHIRPVSATSLGRRRVQFSHWRAAEKI